MHSVNRGDNTLCLMPIDVGYRANRSRGMLLSVGYALSDDVGDVILM